MKQILLKTWLILLCLLCGAGTMWGAIETGTYTLCTSTSDLVAGAHYIIASGTSGSVNVISNVENANNRKIVSATVTDSNIKVASNSTIMTFSLGGSTDAWTFSTDNYAGTNGYLASAASGNNNYCRVISTSTTSTISFSSNAVVITLQPHTTRNILRFNSSSSCFACYSTGQAAVYLYKKTSDGGSNPTSYTVTVANNITGGTVSASTTSATAGATVNLTATPATGYEFGSWNVTDASSNAITVTNNKFTMPASDVNVSATFNKDDGTTYNFADMTDFSSWGTSYEKKTTTFSDGAYVELATANKSTSTVTDCPITKGGDVIFKAPTGKKISSLTFTCTQWTTKAQTITLNTSSNGTDFTATSTTSSNFVLSASNLTNVTAVKFTFSSTSNQVGIKSIKVTYADDDTPVKPTPTLSFASPTYNATMGEDFTAPTLTNTENVTVTYSSSETGVATVNATTGAVSLVAPGTTTITASFAGNETYNEASASYTLEVAAAPVPTLTTMDEIYAMAQEVNGTETDVNVVFNNWIVSGVNGSNAYVTNGTKGFIIYKSVHNFVAGDILSGTVSAKIKMFNNAAEFTTITSITEGLTVTKGGSATEQTIAIADLAGINTGALVAYEGLTYHLNGTSPEFSDGKNVIVAYKGIINTLPELVEGKTYNIKGVFLMYGTKKEILPRSAEDIKLVEELTKYVVTIETPENGSLTIKDGETVINNGDEVEEGTELTIEVKAADGYRFKNWGYKDGEAAWVGNNTATFTHTMPSAPCSFKATFELIPTYTINWSVNGTIVKTQDLKEGAEVTAPEAPEDINGKTFTGWVTTPTVDANATPAYVTPSTATTDVTYYAVFATYDSEATPDQWQTTTLSALTSNDVFVMASGTNAISSANGTSGNPVAVALTVSADKVTSEVTDAIKWTLTGNATDGYTFYKNGSTDYLYVNTTASSSSNTCIRVGTQSSNIRNNWKPDDNGYLKTNDSYTARYLSFYSTGSDFRGYVNTSNGAFAPTFYKLIPGKEAYSNFTTTPSPAAPVFTPQNLTFKAENEDGYWATFSSSEVTFWPDDYVVSAVFVQDDALSFWNGYSAFEEVIEDVDAENTIDGFYVPANTGVIVNSVDADVTYYTVANKTPQDLVGSYNMLVPCPTTGTCPTVDGTNYYYKLAYGDNTNKTKLGFWWGAEDGSGNFNVKAGGAVLVVPMSAGSNLRGFSFDYEDTLTGLDALEIANDSVIYNIQGQRISRIQQGVNIVNGKKVIR